MTITIEIDLEEVAKEMITGMDKVGNNNWSIVINLDGDIDVTHDTYDNSEYIAEVYNFYSGYDSEQLGVEKFADSDGDVFISDVPQPTIDEVVELIKTIIDIDRMEETANEFSDEKIEFVFAEIENDQ